MEDTSSKFTRSRINRIAEMNPLRHTLGTYLQTFIRKFKNHKNRLIIFSQKNNIISVVTPKRCDVDDNIILMIVGYNLHILATKFLY